MLVCMYICAMVSNASIYFYFCHHYFVSSRFSHFVQLGFWTIIHKYSFLRTLRNHQAGWHAIQRGIGFCLVSSGRSQKKCFQGGKGAIAPPFWHDYFQPTKKGGGGLSPPKYLVPQRNLSPTLFAAPQNAAKRRKTPQNAVNIANWR